MCTEIKEKPLVISWLWMKRTSWVIPLTAISYLILLFSRNLPEWDYGRANEMMAINLLWFGLFPSLMLLGLFVFLDKIELVFHIAIVVISYAFCIIVFGKMSSTGVLFSKFCLVMIGVAIAFLLVRMILAAKSGKRLKVSLLLARTVLVSVAISVLPVFALYHFLRV